LPRKQFPEENGRHTAACGVKLLKEKNAGDSGVNVKL
jgi:hypothetical protein